jgi:hypothetical protein
MSDPIGDWRDDFQRQQSENMAQQHLNATNASTRQMANTANATASWQLQQAQEAWDLKKKQADQSGAMASEFLQMWSGAMKDTSGMFKQAFDALSGITGSVTASGNEATKKLYGIADTIGQEYASYRSQVGDTEAELLGGAREEALARKGAVGTFQEGLKADYASAEGRAAADVRTQGEAQAQGEARKQMSMGVDPSSGRFGALSKKGALGTARDTAIAMNVARRGEKERVTGVAAQGLQLLDPNKTGGTAIALRKAGTEMLGQQAGVMGKAADVETAKTQAISNVATATGSLANAYGQNITQPYGEMAGYFLGQSGGAISPNSSGSSNFRVGGSSGVVPQ